MWYPWVFRALTPPSLPFLGEEEISFPPTYRYERGSRDTYAWHKQKPTGVSEENGLGPGEESRVCVGSSLCTYHSSLYGPLRPQGCSWVLEVDVGPSVVGAWASAKQPPTDP